MSDTSNSKLKAAKAKLIWQRLDGLKKPLSPKRRLEIIEKLKSTDHKLGVDPSDWDQVGDNLLKICEYFVNRCTDKGLKVLWTSIIRPKIVVDGKVISKTDIHSKKRAADARTAGWPKGAAKEMEEELNEALSEIGAIGIASGTSRAAVYEDGVTAGWGEHLHLQGRP